MAEEETDRDLAAGFLASELMKETQSYLERGRRLQGLTDAQLASKWVVDFQTWRGSRADQDDPGNSSERRHGGRAEVAKFGTAVRPGPRRY